MKNTKREDRCFQFRLLERWLGISNLIKASLVLVITFFLCPNLRGETSVTDHPPVKGLESKAPVFGSTTRESILLRYKLKRDQIMKIVDDTNTDIQMSMGTEKMNMGEHIHIEAKARVTEVDEKGNISMLVKITRLTLKMTGIIEVEFDSEKPENANPHFKAVTAMIGVGIPCKISPVGELLETDLEPLRLAALRANSAALMKAFDESASKMFEGTFIQLSKDPVSAGQIYEAGTIVSGPLKAYVSYKIESVDSDKRKAIMSPIVVLDGVANTIPDPESGATITNQEVSGWLLFDVEKGFVSDGQISARQTGEFVANGQTIRIELKMIMMMAASLN